MIQQPMVRISAEIKKIHKIKKMLFLAVNV